MIKLITESNSNNYKYKGYIIVNSNRRGLWLVVDPDTHKTIITTSTSEDAEEYIDNHISSTYNEGVMLNDLPTNKVPTPSFVGASISDEDYDDLTSVKIGPEIITPINSQTVISQSDDQYDEETPELSVVNDEDFSKTDESSYDETEVPELITNITDLSDDK